MYKQETVLVCILTYKRQQLLVNAIESVLPQIDSERFTLLIVDNDPEGSAEQVVSDVGRPDLRYVVEPTPGIAAARNAGLSFARKAGYTALVFLDDDEYVTPGWLAALENCKREFSADVVCGPVIPDFESEDRPYLRRSGLYDRPDMRSGERVRWPATNNCWISLSGVVEEYALNFDARFALTGGEDSEFFRQVESGGGRIVGCSTAVVYERVPATRVTLGWLWRRNVRLGNTSAIVTHASRSARFIKAVALMRIGLAAPIFLSKSILFRRLAWPALTHIPKGIGMIQASRGRLTLEYQRPGKGMNTLSDE